VVTVYKCGASTCSFYDPDCEDRNKCTLDEITIDSSGSCDSYQTRAEDMEEN
jgi:hypothetical protein